MYLSLDENKWKACCDTNVKHLNGVKILLSTLKSLFAKYISQTAFIAYAKFEMFKRLANMNILNFINLKSFVTI